MSLLAVALCERRPEPALVVQALALAGPTARVEVAGGGAVRLLVDDRDGLLCAVQAPLLVQVPGEARRLLGPSAPEGAGRWWVEVLVPAPTAASAALAGRVVDHLARATGGDAWRGPTGWGTDLLGGLDVVADGHPAADATTGAAVLVLADRPVVALDRALADLLATSAGDGREVHLLTPAVSRLTPALADLVRARALRWLVPAPEAHDREACDRSAQDAATPWRDAVTGLVHHLGHDGRAEPWAPSSAGAAASDAPGDDRGGADARTGVVVLEATARHAPGAGLVLGALAEALCRAVTGLAPGGWGTAEPATQPWSPHALTRYCRERAPTPTRLCLVGPTARASAGGSLVVRRTRTAVVEEVRWQVAVPAPPTTQELGEAALASAGAVEVESVVVGLRPGGAEDASTPAGAAPVVPVGVLLGPAEVARLGRDRVLALPVAAEVVLDAASGAAWCPTLGGHHAPFEVMGRLLASVADG